MRRRSGCAAASPSGSRKKTENENERRRLHGTPRCDRGGAGARCIHCGHVGAGEVCPECDDLLRDLGKEDELQLILKTMGIENVAVDARMMIPTTKDTERGAR